jgi:hypothetical protein
MADEVTKKDLDSLKTQIESLRNGFENFRDKYEKDQSGVTRAILEGDKVAEKLAEPLRKAVADLTKRVAALE